VPVVLVVEDDQLNMKLVRALLRLRQVRVLEAADGEAGLRIARQQRPDLILMDIRLPGMDGVEATKMLKSDTDLAAIPVVALSSYAMKEDIDRAVEAGCCRYLTKPIDRHAFADTVAELIRYGGREGRRS
jgi:CheY-like chemotaxis protein